MTRTAVITGVGAVTPLGVGARTLHERWSAGQSGIEDGFGRASEFEPKEHLSVKEVRRSDRYTQLALAAAAEALEDAGWDGNPPYDPDRAACVIGTGIGGIGTLETQHIILRDEGADRISPLSIPLLMANAASGVIAMKHDLRGQSFGTVSACAAGAHAIGMAERLIRYGDADAVVTGGSEAAITPLATAAFASMDALSDSGVSRPFDRRRDGFVMGEGAGILVLEEEEAARERGARILGYIRGYASTSDAHHLTAPEPNGRGAAKAMELAMKDAGVDRGAGALRECPRDLDSAERPVRDERHQGRARRGAGGEDAGQLDQVGHRPSARRRRRGGGHCDPAGAPRPDRAADPELRGARRGARPGLRAERGPSAAERRLPRDRAVERVRLRWAQRRPLPGGFMSALADRMPAERISPLLKEPREVTARDRLELLCDPGSLHVIRSTVLPRRESKRMREGDGVIGAAGTIAGRPVYCYAQDQIVRRRLAG